MCPRCSATVFGHRNDCFKCLAPKPAALREEEEARQDGVSRYNKRLFREMRLDQQGGGGSGGRGEASEGRAEAESTTDTDVESSSDA